MAGTVGELSQLVTGGPEFGEPTFDVLAPKLLVDELGRVCAGGQAVVADGEDLSDDLGEGEPGRLRLTDEGDPVDGVGLVVALAAGGALGFG